MELVTPGIGLLFWMLLAFSIVLVLLKKFAWKPILKALKDREDSIQSALDKADEARRLSESANEDVEKMILEGRRSRERMLKDAKDEIAEYKKAQKEMIKSQVNSELTAAKEEIQQQKRLAVDELKKSIASISVEIAEKIIKKELESKSRYDQLIEDSVKNLNI